MKASILNIAGYQFVALTKLDVWRSEVKAECQRLNLQGTILLAPEGINIMLAAEEPIIREFQRYLAKYPEFSTIQFKETWSELVPFKRMLVKLKKGLIPNIAPVATQAKFVKPKQLADWLAEDKVKLLDTRNAYELKHGKFKGAIDLDIADFAAFPQAISEKIEPELKEQPVVIYCTGGIRCEKAASVMQEQGFKEVYQLEGGILNYFEQCGGEHYEGDCFVFDERVALKPELDSVSGV